MAINPRQADYYDSRAGTASAQTAAGGAAAYAAKTQPPAPSPLSVMSAGGAAPYAARTQPAPAPAPTYRAPAPAYTPPSYQAPIQQSYQQPFQQQQQNFVPQGPPPPPPRPLYAPGGRQEFNQWAPEQRQLAEDQYLGGDSDYTAQVGLYQKALDDFVRRITGRIEGFETDATQATAGNLKNEGMSLNNLGEDFGARGLSYSGLFDKSKNKMADRYKEGRGNIEKNKNTNVTNARNDQADYTAENEIGRANAKRSSLLRMAAAQNLRDAQY